MQRLPINALPTNYQLSIRLKDLIAAHGPSKVFKYVEERLVFYNSPSFLEDPKYKPNRHNADEMLAINVIQTIRYFGAEEVKNYISKVFTLKVG